MKRSDRNLRAISSGRHQPEFSLKGGASASRTGSAQQYGEFHLRRIILSSRLFTLDARRLSLDWRVLNLSQK